MLAQLSGVADPRSCRKTQKPYAVAPFNDGSIRRAWKSPELGS